MLDYKVQKSADDKINETIYSTLCIWHGLSKDIIDKESVLKVHFNLTTRSTIRWITDLQIGRNLRLFSKS